MNKLQNKLFLKQDLKYRDFVYTITPSINKKTIIGVRVKDLRTLAKELYLTNEYQLFLDNLPHKYYEENILHSIILTYIKDYDECLNKVKEFLPYLDNWAVCDILHPKCFKDNTNLLIKDIKIWLKSKETYTLRYAINVLMTYYLDDNFKSQYLDLIANIKSNEYYVNMMRAWYFAEAMVKQPSVAITYLKENRLDKWTHLKTISKCIDSYRIDDKTKDILKGLR